MDAFHEFRVAKTGVADSREAEFSTTICSSNYRANNDDKPKPVGKMRETYAVLGLYASVCDHGAAVIGSSRLMFQPERLENPQFVLAYERHHNGSSPNVGVFGPAIPLERRSNPAFCVSALTCKLLVRLKNESPEVLDDTQVALGKLHGKIVLSLIVLF
jgi:hypothetical protein